MNRPLSTDDIKFLCDKHDAEYDAIIALMMVFRLTSVPSDVSTIRALRAIADMFEMRLTGVSKESL